MSDTLSAAQSLAAAEAARARMAAAGECPPSRHAVFALLFGGVVAVQAFAFPWNLVGDVLLLLGAGVTAMVDRARKGVFLNGYRSGNTRAVTLALLAFELPVFVATYWLRMEREVIWAPLAGGAMVAVVAYFASRRWSRVYRREMEQAL